MTRLCAILFIIGAKPGLLTSKKNLTLAALHLDLDWTTSCCRNKHVCPEQCEMEQRVVTLTAVLGSKCSTCIANANRISEKTSAIAWLSASFVDVDCSTHARSEELLRSTPTSSITSSISSLGVSRLTLSALLDPRRQSSKRRAAALAQGERGGGDPLLLQPQAQQLPGPVSDPQA